MVLDAIDADAIILGGGAAGLKCAADLARAKISFVLLEARSRLGGRIFTTPSLDRHRNLDLGAEFIHGRPCEILELLERSGKSFYDVADQHLCASKKGLKPFPDFFGRIEKVMAQLKLQGRDRSVEEFLRARRTLPAELRSMFVTFVEGFHAADIRLIGEQFCMRGLRWIFLRGGQAHRCECPI